MNDGARAPGRPLQGPRRFDDSELDERFFFGRDRETEIVASNLVASRLTVLYGPSGVGKSSLLRAGVVRRLRALVPAGGGGGDGNGALPVVVDQWRDDPLAAIAAAAGTPVPESPEELADVLAERSAQIGGEIYLVLDQMEEYFVYHGRDGGGPLREALAEILTRPTLRVHVLLGIRDDALAELDAFKGRVPGLFGNVLRLDHLDVDAARAAIVEPLAELEAMGGPHVVAEAALVAAVVDQVASGRIERRLAGRGIVEGGAAPRPRRGAVPPARDGADLGGGARTRLVRPARGDARGARRRGPDRPAAPRAGACESRRAGAGARRAAVPSARDAVGDEDRARRRRSQPVRRRVARSGWRTSCTRSRTSASSGRSPRGTAAARATRSTTTSSPAPCWTGARATKRSARSPRSARRRGGGTGGWRRSSASAPWRWR